MYSTNFTVPNAKFYLSLHYNSDDNYLFVNGKEIIKFKANVSADNIIKTGLNAYIYDFRVDYWDYCC